MAFRNHNSQGLSTHLLTIFLLGVLALWIKGIHTGSEWQLAGVTTFSLGFMLLTSYVAAQILGVAKLPLVSGYIFVGIFAGPHVTGFLNEAMVDVFSNTQHLNANIQIKVDGDYATGRVMCFNPMEMNTPDDGTHVFMLGLWYVDKYVRTEKGWRIKERLEEKSWAFNLPEFMEF